MFKNVEYISCGKFVSNGEWIHPDRKIDSYEIIYVTKGCVYISENGTDYVVCKHECIILEPSMHHYGYKYSSDVEFFWMHWSGKVNTQQYIKHIKLVDNYTFLLFFKQLIHNRIKKDFDECFNYLTRLILNEVYSSNTMPEADDLAENIELFIKANNSKQISVADVSKHLGYNSDYLNRVFKRTYNKSIKQYIDEEKIKLIKTLILNEKMTLKEVAKAAGFEEYKYFLKFFKYHENFTPKEFQKLYSVVYINTH